MDNSQRLYGHCELADLGVLAVRGRDAVAFLQGQLSQDVTRLAVGTAAFAGCHTPQGRVIAVVRLLPAAEGIDCILPQELIEPLAAHLRKYVLRAKLTLTDGRGALRVLGIVQGGMRTLRAVAAGDAAAGMPQVYRATSGRFIAQMLNLDCVAGIAFDKGCYTGQEIIARAHYRGRVKRRMQRFRSLAPPRAPLGPGASGVLADGRPFEVVDAVTLADGRVEFLAVASLTGEPLAGEPAAGASAATSRREAAIEVESLPLPYALPD